MKKSPRAIRMERRHNRHKVTAALNLTSLMDIFTILVFFLLVNSSNTQQLPDNKDIVLPESVAEELPHEVLTIQLSGKDIIVQDIKIASVPDVLASEEDVIPALLQELEYRISRSLPVINEDGEPEREVMIIGDRNIPYTLLKRVMVTCNKTEYTKISFAVLRKAEDQS